jgi:hypothetical protein
MAGMLLVGETRAGFLEIVFISTISIALKLAFLLVMLRSIKVCFLKRIVFEGGLQGGSGRWHREVARDKCLKCFALCPVPLSQYGITGP